jgi:hypothetical protein
MREHGFWMWFCWSVVSLLLIFTNRYLKHFYQWRQIAHVVLGSACVGLTWFEVKKAWQMRKEILVQGKHPQTAMLLYNFMFYILIIGAVGMLARFTFMRGWETKKQVFGHELRTYDMVTWVINTHKVLAYALIFFS